ncbi:MAG: hypothetical protein FJZ56_02965, partial [Chlamydiae bacterium]|nr:hypothetical protein [Chlamydiota bacterium]
MAIDSTNTVLLSKAYDHSPQNQIDLCRSLNSALKQIPFWTNSFWDSHAIHIHDQSIEIGTRALENLDLIQALYLSASKSNVISLKDKIDLREKIKALFVSRNRFFIDPSILVPLLIVDSEGKSASIFLQVDRILPLPFFQKLLFANFAENESISRGGSAKILLPKLTNINNFIHYLYFHKPKNLHEIIQLYIIADYLADFEVAKRYLETLFNSLPTSKDDLLTVLTQSPIFSEPIANLYYSSVLSKYIQACLVDGGINQEVKESFFNPHVREILSYTTLQLKISDGKLHREDLLFLESVIPQVSLLNIAHCEIDDLPPVWQNSLEYINISHTQIQTIPAGFTYLKEFAALSSYSLRDISGLSGLQKLEKIIAQHTLIKSAPYGCISLQIFDAYSSCFLEDVSGLDHLPNLKQIDISCSRAQRAPIGCKSLEIFGAYEANLLVNTLGLNNLQYLKDIDISETLATSAPVGCLNL